MWQIVRNGIGRMWWLYLLSAITSLIAFPNGHEEFIHFSAAIIFFTGILTFAFETSGFGKFRVHTMLPVSAAQRGCAYSVLFVVIAPVINILIYMMGAIPHLLMPKVVPEPAPFFWYIAVVLFVMGFLCFFLQTVRLGIRFPYGWKKAIWELSSVTFLLIMLVVVIYFICRVDAELDYFRRGQPFSFFLNGLTLLFGPKTDTLTLSDIVALCVAVLCIVLTFYKAAPLGSYISWLALQQEHGDDDTILPVNNRAYGFYEPWIREIQRTIRLVGLLFFSSCGGLLMVWLLDPQPLPRLYLGFLTAAPWPFILIVITGLLSIPPIIPWFVALRSLRMLPLSRKSLMFYLASIPLLVFVVYSVVLLAACLYFKDWNYALNLEWCLIVVFGFSMIANSLVLLSRHTLLTFLALFCPTITAILIFYSYSDPVEAARQMTFLYKVFTGVALLAVGYAGLYVTLAYSLPYRTKPWFG